MAPQDEKEWQTDVWYGYAKLANIWFTRELQRRLREKGSRANVYCFHPGLVQTEGRKQFPKVLFSFAFFVFAPFFCLFFFPKKKKKKKKKNRG